MRRGDRPRRRGAFAGLLAGVLIALAGCGGGTSSETRVICRDKSICTADLAAQDTPTGPNTTEIVVDSGPPNGFALGVTNVPYVSVKVCAPGTQRCATVDHVLLDTGSYGLRLLKSKVAAIGLPAVPVAADAASATPAGDAAECYAFVLGAVWGPLATADVHIGGETAPAISVQLIDDAAVHAPPVPPNCTASADGQLLDSVAMLQANGILGIGAVGVDCGLACLGNDYPGGYVVYYSCPPGGAACQPAGLPAARQVQNPVVHFARNNNGTMIAMPALPELGALKARGRLVFGIGTQANNQLPPSATMLRLDNDPASPDYLYLGVRVAGRSYPQSFVDTGANAYFFHDRSLPQTCAVTTGQSGGWYCPASTWQQAASVTDMAGTVARFDVTVSSADALFNTGAPAFATLAGTAGAGSQSFALGLPFFYGRTVYTAIWGQALATVGPWVAF